MSVFGGSVMSGWRSIKDARLTLESRRLIVGGNEGAQAVGHEATGDWPLDLSAHVRLHVIALAEVYVFAWLNLT